jgi:phosphomannomutase
LFTVKVETPFTPYGRGSNRQDAISVTVAQPYVCPGEQRPISRSVHLARLAAFDPACRTCSRRHEAGPFPLITPEDLELQARAARRSSWLTPTGIRAIFRNELDRPKAMRWGLALGQRLCQQWKPQCDLPKNEPDPEATCLIGDETTGTLPEEVEIIARPADLPPGPVVVVGYDSRPHSPEIVHGLGLGLRRLGCRVVDIGRVSSPCFRFAVSHFSAALGAYVTGGSGGPEWTGFDVVDEQGVPWTIETGLREWERAAADPAEPVCRFLGGLQSATVQADYEKGLRETFHGLRPMKLVLATNQPPLAKLVQSLVDGLPINVIPLPLGTRGRSLFDARDPDVVRLGEAVRNSAADLGIVLADNGEQWSAVDEEGQLVPLPELAGLVAREAFAQDSGTAVVATLELATLLSRLAERDGRVCHTVSLPELATHLLHSRPAIGFDGDGRVFRAQERLVCDAVLSIGLLLQALSHGDTALSRLIAAL